MANNKELVTVLTVKTEQSQNTIKGLRKEIADLKKQLDSAVIGSEEFETASRELAQAQANLKTVMADGKKTTDAVEGSYNHLVATMAELKKQWKATADEVKRNELGLQIDNINNQLKGLDGSIGNFQRNVGNYAEDFKKAMQDQADSTVIVKTKLEGIQKVATGLAAGYAAVQGAMNLLNIENAEFEKAMIKVQSAMAIAQGIGGMKDLIEGADTLKVAFGSAGMAAKTMATETAVASTAMNGAAASTVVATTAMERFKLALIKTGIGALIVGIGVAIAYVVENWDKLKKSLGFDDTLERQAELAKEAAEQMQEFRKSVAGTASSVLAKYQILQTAYKSLKNEHQKKEWIEQNKTEFEKLGLSVNTLNEAENAFVKNTDKVVDAMIKRAMATAKEQQLVELTAKYLEEQAKAEDLYNKSKYKAGEKNFSSSHDATTGDEYLDRDGYWRFTEQGAKKVNEKLEKSVFETANNYKAQMNKLANDIVTINAETEGIIAKSGGVGNGNSGNTEDSVLKRAKEIAEKARKAVIDTKEEELAELKRIYDEEKAVLELYEIDTTNLTEVYESKKKEIVEKYNQERKNAEQELTDYFKTDKDLELEKVKIKYDKYLELFKDNKEKLLEVEKWYQAELERITTKHSTSGNTNTSGKTPAEILIEQQGAYSDFFKWLQEKGGDTAAIIAAGMTQALSSASQIIGALQEGIDKTTEEGFEKNKRMQKAQAWINIAQGILAAISSAMQLGPIVGPIIGAANAALVGTVGAIQISNINKQKFNGESPSGNIGAGVSPSINIADAMPVQYTRELLTDSETTNLNKEQKVYVLENDISTTQDRVRVTESNSSF